MRKFTQHVLVLLFISTIFSSINAQVYLSEDFETDLGVFTAIDADNDGYGWEIVNYGDEQGQIVQSESWSGGTVLYPDNWLVSSGIDLSSASMPYLFWKVKAQDQAWADENYTVYVGTSSETSVLETSNVTFNEVIGTSDGYESRMLDLSSLAGESSVYIAFRHHNVSDMFVLNIDDIVLSNIVGESASVTLTSSETQYATSATSTHDFEFDVTSYSENDLSGYEFHYTIDGTNSNMSGSQTLGLGDSEAFSFSLGLGDYSVSVSVYNASGELISEIVEYSLSVVSPTPNFTLTDSYGNDHDLHEYLSENNSVLLQFDASFNFPGQSATPEVNSVWEAFGEGETGFQVMLMSVEPTDNNSVINNLGWGAEYPKFAYDITNDIIFSHYASMVGAGGGISFFVLLCPNTDNPEFSDITYWSEGWGTLSSGGTSMLELENAVIDCPSSINIFFGCTDEFADNYNEEANIDDGSCFTTVLGCTDNNAYNFNFLANTNDGSCLYYDSTDTLFYYDCNNILIIDNTDYENFEIMQESFDEGVPSPYDGETDADVLDYVSSFFLQYTTNQPNGVASFDYDENPDPSVPDSAWYFTAYSWFTDPTIQADNWLGMGPVTIPDEEAALKFQYRGAVTQWKDGFDLYITEAGMEPYNDVNPGETDIAYSIESETPASASDTTWAEHTVSLNDFAGKSIYFTFHHTATDMERIMLDNFLIITYSLSGCTSEWADNYNHDATEDDGSCELTACPYSQFIEYNPNYTIADVSLCSAVSVEGCTNVIADNYNQEANLDDGSCIIFGCLNPEADNFNPDATNQDDSCELFGCLNPEAYNYNDQATTDNDSCIIFGCTLSIFPNYNPAATSDDLSCSFDDVDIFGCTDETALNYNFNSNIDDGSCQFNEESNCINGYTITLQEGWNLFGYSCLEISLPVEDVLYNIIDLITIVKDNSGNVYLPEWNFNNIGNFYGGFGYQIKITQEISEFNICD